MTDLRTAAQQALEALEMSARFVYADNRPQCEEAITALRAALAEPQSTHSADCWKWHHECAIARIEETEELREALKTALAEPVQPVAWLSRDDARLALWEAINRREFGNPTDDKLILDHLHQRGLWIGKYTAPPKRDPLTDEQISDLWHQSGEQPFKFARMLLK